MPFAARIRSGFDDGGFADAGTAYHHSDLGHQRKNDRRDLACGQGQSDVLLTHGKALSGSRLLLFSTCWTQSGTSAWSVTVIEEASPHLLGQLGYADFRCGLVQAFSSLPWLPFCPEIGISISFCPADALRGFLADFCGAFSALRRQCSAATPPSGRRRCSAAGRSFGRDRLAGSFAG